MLNARARDDRAVARRDRPNVAWRRLADGGVVIYDYERGGLFQLNRTAGFVWQAIDGIRSTAAIEAEVERELGHRVADDVWECLLELTDLRVVTLDCADV